MKLHSYLNVYIAVGVEGAVDHMQGDIDVWYRVKEVYHKRLLHLHDDGFLHSFFFIALIRRYNRAEGEKNFCCWEVLKSEFTTSRNTFQFALQFA